MDVMPGGALGVRDAGRPARPRGPSDRALAVVAGLAAPFGVEGGLVEDRQAAVASGQRVGQPARAGQRDDRARGREVVMAEETRRWQVSGGDDLRVRSGPVVLAGPGSRL